VTETMLLLNLKAGHATHRALMQLGGYHLSSETNWPLLCALDFTRMMLLPLCLPHCTPLHRYLGDRIRTSCRITVGGINETVLYVLKVTTVLVHECHVSTSYTP
jgi:hypothetical protein